MVIVPRDGFGNARIDSGIGVALNSVGDEERSGVCSDPLKS
jgi:hypothetical protein